MKTKEELLERYYLLYRKAVAGKDPKKMRMLGEAENRAFGQLAKAHPEMAENWLSQLEGMEWENYLSEREMQNIGKRISNQDGTKGFHWNHDTFTKAVDALGGKTEEMPYYNPFALTAVANMVYSDHAKSIAEDMGYKNASEVPNEKMALSAYRKAVELLKDPDKGFNVREYFKRRMFDDSPAE